MEKGKIEDVESGTVVGSVPAAATEINGTKKEPPVATYKSIPDDDSNWQEKNNKVNQEDSEKMGKLNEDEAGADDGANEKMLNDESSKIVPAKEPTEVKFISENGDAKIDIETVKKTLSGMGKEELMKYANDPFWIRLRWFLFVTFWLVWLAMLVGAVAIIVMAPKCSAPQPKKWWEESPIVQLEPHDVDASDESSLGTLFDTLQTQHIKVVSLFNFLDVNGHTKDFRDVQPKVGTIAKVDAIIESAKKRNLRVVLEIDPNHSSVEHPWFEKSVNRDDPHTDFYVWANAKTNEATGTRTPPNNWLSVNGGSAWEWNDKRGQYYLHQFNKTQPDLNFNNPSVVAEFTDTLRFWLARKISGFRLGNTRYLTEDPKLRDESLGTGPANIDEYHYLNHAYTYDRSENGPILRQWREMVDNQTNNDGFFALRDNIGNDIVTVYNENRTLIDAPQSSVFLETATAGITAETLLTGVDRSIAASGGWPSWDVNGNEANLRKRMPGEIADSIVLMTLLLPGTPILKLNDTIGEAFATTAKARSVQTFSYGSTETRIVNGTVFVYTRLKSGNPGYLVAYQSGDEPAYIDLSKFKSVSSEVNVLAYSSNYVQDGGTIQTKLPSDKVPISPKSTLVVTFVPKEE